MTTVLLLHGVQSGASTWWRVADDLRALGFAVITPDLPGHGGRAGTPEPSLDAVVHAIEAEITAPVVVVGHSLGAVVALRLAATRPDLVTGVLLEDPPALDGRPLRDVVGDVGGAAEAARQDPEALIDALLADHPTWARHDAEHVAANRAVLDTAFVEAFVRREEWDLETLLAAAPVPVALLAAAGPDSALVGRERAVLLDALPHTLVESGHGVHRDRPGVWTAVVAGFAAALPPTGDAGALPSAPGREGP